MKATAAWFRGAIEEAEAIAAERTATAQALLAALL